MFMELNALDPPFPKFPSSCLRNNFSSLKFLVLPLKFPIPPLKFLVPLLKFPIITNKTTFSLGLQNIPPSFVPLTWIFPSISQDPIIHLQQFWLDEWFIALQKNVHDNMNYFSFVDNFSNQSKIGCCLLNCPHEVVHLNPFLPILMEWSLFVKYNVLIALWFSNKFFNTHHIFVGSRKSSTIGIRLSLIDMIKIVKALSFLDRSKVTFSICCTLTTIVCCIVVSSYIPTASSTTHSSWTMTCAWTMDALVPLLLQSIPLGKPIPILQCHYFSYLYLINSSNYWNQL